MKNASIHKNNQEWPLPAFRGEKISEKIILTDENGISVKYGNGESFEIKSDPVALCRCGLSHNAPFCDGSHISANWDGTETASFKPIIEQQSAEALKGPQQTLIDNENYCAFARFCDRGGRIWNLVMQGGDAANKLSAKEANLCPSGRLMMFTNQGENLEELSEPLIHTIEDDGLKSAGHFGYVAESVLKAHLGNVMKCGKNKHCVVAAPVEINHFAMARMPV